MVRDRVEDPQEDPLTPYETQAPDLTASPQLFRCHFEAQEVAKITAIVLGP